MFDDAMKAAADRSRREQDAASANERMLQAAQADARGRARDMLADVRKAINALVNDPRRAEEAREVEAGRGTFADAFYLNRAVGTAISPSLMLVSAVAPVPRRSGLRRSRPIDAPQHVHAGWNLTVRLERHDRYRGSGPWVNEPVTYRPTGERVVNPCMSLRLDLLGTAIVQGDLSLEAAANQGIIRAVSHDSSGTAELNLVDVSAGFETAIMLIAGYLHR